MLMGRKRWSFIGRVWEELFSIVLLFSHINKGIFLDMLMEGDHQKLRRHEAVRAKVSLTSEQRHSEETVHPWLMLLPQ